MSGDQNGALSRSVSPRDRRSFEVHRTRAGRSLARRVAREFENEARRLAAGLGPREQELRSTLITGILLEDAAERGVELFPGLHAAGSERA